jgi:hypothetical protein
MYCHPSNVVTRQAANMNWVAVGKIPAKTGGTDVLLRRGENQASISWRDGKVTLYHPPCSELFDDFIAVERWLTLNETPEAEDDPHYDYVEKVQNFIKSQEGKKGLENIYATFLAMQATNLEYLQLSYSVINAGYEYGVNPVIIGAHIIDAIGNAKAKGYDETEFSIPYLQSIEKAVREGKYE